jgi:hypothetical protein
MHRESDEYFFMRCEEKARLAEEYDVATTNSQRLCASIAGF